MVDDDDEMAIFGSFRAECRSWVVRGLSEMEARDVVRWFPTCPVICPLCLLPSGYCSEPFVHDQQFAEGAALPVP